MKVVKTLLFIGGLFAVVASANADTWEVSKAPSNASVNKAAKVSNESGDVLYLWPGSQANGVVGLYGELQLAPGKTFSNESPRYQIDQGLIVKLNRIPLAPFKSKEGWLRITDKIATWKLSDAVKKIISKDEPLYSWLTGDRVRFIYFDVNGREKTTEFSLNGSSRAVASVAGVSTE